MMYDYSTLLEHFTLFRTLATHGIDYKTIYNYLKGYSEQRYCLQTSNLYNTYVRSAWIHHSLLWEVDSGNPMTPLIPRIESAKVGSISLAYLIRPGVMWKGGPPKWGSWVPILPGKWGSGSLYSREYGDPDPHFPREYRDPGSLYFWENGDPLGKMGTPCMADHFLGI